MDVNLSRPECYLKIETELQLILNVSWLFLKSEIYSWRPSLYPPPLYSILQRLF